MEADEITVLRQRRLVLAELIAILDSEHVTDELYRIRDSVRTRLSVVEQSLSNESQRLENRLGEVRRALGN